MMLTIQSKKQGAELTSIQYEGKEKLHQGEKVVDQKGEPYWKRQAPILFPIVGQIKDGTTRIKEKTYEMGQHGFARDMEFEEVVKTKTIHQYVLKSSRETQKKFPFLFELWITYEVKDDTLEVTYQVKNIDQEVILFGIGAHPAFKCEYETGEYEICFEKNEDKIEFLKLQNGLISQEKGENKLKENKLLLEENTFLEDAIIMKNLNSEKVTLQNAKTGKKVLEFTFKGFPYLAIWSKKGAPFVCIEPWQTIADRS